MVDIKDFIKEFKEKHFKLSEILAVIAITVIVCILIQLYQGFIVRKAVIKDSYCYNNKNNPITNTSVQVQNLDGVQLYSVTYDLPNKDVAINCTCPTGDVVNKFENIKIYNYQTHSADSASKYCNCNSQYGVPNVTIFDENKLNGFLDSILGYIRKCLNTSSDNINITQISIDSVIGETTSSNQTITIPINYNYESASISTDDINTLNTCLGNLNNIQAYMQNTQFANDDIHITSSPVNNNSSSTISVTYTLKGYVLEDEYTTQFMYSGDPDAIRFMKNNDTYLFDRNLDM